MNKNTLTFLMSLLGILCLSDASFAELIGTWKCGYNCTATLDDTGHFFVSGTGATYAYSHNNQPWSEYLSAIKSVKVEGLSKINTNLTYDSPITSLELSDSVTNIAGGFEGNQVSLLELPNYVTEISNFGLASGVTQEIIIPDTITTLGANAFGHYKSMQNKKIICRGSNCAAVKKLFEKYNTYAGTADISGSFFLADSSNCDSQNYYWSGESCNNKKDGINCAENWKKIEDWCNRVRYTPAEAAAVLKDTDNTIIMTFKVNR
ncbi:MAG: leucine-rich repeat protein [Alphaproteobacteria bacterium]|nr:leucine-rich repeat protein [Alphaproteobacteria bacterium]